ncbi:unnamed protein product [Heterobilharzia americana]|nr:unnamed protein product [Heterobilharzia americana]
MTKKTGQKLKQFKPSKYDLLNIVQSLRDKYRICFTKKLTMQHIRKQVNRYENNNVVSVDGGDECDADRMQNKEKLNEGDYETDSTGPKLSVYICYCCGSICTCQLSFKWLNRKDHFRHMTRYHDNESYLTEPLAKSLNEYSERRVLSEAVIADLVKHTRNSSRASNSNSSRHYGSKNSNGPMGTGNIIAGTNQQHEKATDTISSTGKYGKLIKESIQTKTTSYTKSRRRTSSRLSGISFGTMSYLDPSTKQTSLFPSSGMLPTPRSSFLNTASQVSRNENNQEGDDVEQQQQQHNELQVPSISHEVHMNAVNNSYYQLPSTSRYFTPNLLKPLPDVDSMKYEHESSLEDKVKEKLNNSMSIIPLSDIPCHSNHSDNERLDILPEIIKVDVHTQTTEVKYDYSNIRLLKTNRRRNDDYKNNSCTSKHDLTEEDYKGQNTLQIKLSESYAASIPFVDEESSITEEYHPIGFIQTLKDNPLSITYSYITRNETLKEVSDEQTSMDVPVTSSASQQQQEQQNAQMSSQSTLTAATKETQDRNSSRRPSERRGTIDKPIRHRLSFHGKTNVKKPVNSDEKKTQLQKQSSDLFASTSDELSDLDDFAHISRMVAREVMRKQRARERAKSICVTPTVNSRNDKELEDKTTPINTIEKRINPILINVKVLLYFLDLLGLQMLRLDIDLHTTV